MFGRLKSKSAILMRSLLKEGMSVRKIGLCIALGITLGIFPILGITTLLCAAAAFAFRLNLPAIQLVNYMVYPLQIALIAPFYSVGNWLFNDKGSATTVNFIELMKNDFWGSMTNLWNLALYAISIWMVICPFLILVLYIVSKAAILNVSSLQKRRLS